MKSNSTESDNGKSWRIALYIRLSREDSESESIENQLKILEEYLSEEFAGEIESRKAFIDDGISGTDDARAGFTQMLCEIESKNVNCVVCKTLSRAFRNYSDQGFYLEYFFPLNQIRFISVCNPHVDTYENPEIITGLEIPITGLLNDRYAAKTSCDVRRTLATKRRRGEFVGAFAPYGYQKHPENKNRLIIDEAAALVKREMLRWLANDGTSANTIAKRLNLLGIPSPAAHKKSMGINYNNPHTAGGKTSWSGETVRRVLLDKTNLGHTVQGKERVISYKIHERKAVPEGEWVIVKNTHEPIFTEAEFTLIERLLRRKTRVSAAKTIPSEFSGLVRCRTCGKTLCRKSAKGIAYFSCRGCTAKPPSSVRESVLKACVSAVSALLLPPSVVTGAPQESGGFSEKALIQAASELKRTNELSDQSYLDWRGGLITKEAYDRIKQRLLEKKNLLCETISRIKEEKNKAPQGRSSPAESSLPPELLHGITVGRGIIDISLGFCDIFETG